ncbi:MAG: cytochrome c oxidase subunit II [Deltaproteobacteria bacterium]|nr:cytochrome c oxidase subunit II [Deltaproteobacteria bacterium]MBV8453264.1 cytochrome c oxidase subunit II [Deltaproteobacteria bacterium]
MGAANRQIARGAVFSPVSTPASSIATLAWFVLAVTAAIFLIVFALLVYSVVRFRARPTDEPREPAQLYGSNQIEFAWTAIPVLIVFVLVLTTIRTIYDVQAANEPPGAIHVRVIGHQWWWEFQYPDLGIVTANELHIPLSEPAHPTLTWLRLESADVAHSFWVPRLAGKTDLIPNQINTMWMAPHQAGIYLGQCAEFCGTEHAMMLIRVVVEPRPVFDQWIAEQRLSVANQDVETHGRQVFESNACVSCHSVRGTRAHGTYGPDLTHLMGRQTIGSGVALNTPAHLRIWVGNPAVMKPGVLMPAMNLSEHDLDDLVAWMVTLK